jgi:lipopolysaccharide export system protein LptA
LSDLGGEKITRIVARGQVRFVQEDRVATGQEAIYYKDREEVVLLGNPQVWRAENTLKGEKIIFNLKDNKMQVESSPQKRVEAHLYSATSGPAGGKESLPFGPKSRKGRQP